MQITILGCGPSSGVPFYGNRWGNCDPLNLKNIRTRSSVFIQNQDTKILIDTGPDVRQQLLRENIQDLTAVLYTHDHADHTHGIDELRGLATLNDTKYNFWADEITLKSLQARFSYLMTNSPSTETFRPFMTPNLIKSPFFIGEEKIIPFSQNHGSSTSLGFRIGDMAYSTDAAELDEASFEVLRGVKVWIVGALQYDPHVAHANVEQALDWIKRVSPEKAYLTHLSSRLDYEILKQQLPSNIEPCYDGMKVNL